MYYQKTTNDKKNKKKNQPKTHLSKNLNQACRYHMGNK